MVAEGQSVNEFEEDAFRPMCDMDAEETNGKKVENDAVRPECDMDADDMNDNEINIDADRPKRDLDAEDFDEYAKKKNKQEKLEQQQRKRYLKWMRKSR